MIALSFLHIGKTGGTSAKELLKWGRDAANAAGYSVKIHGHKYTLPDTLDDGDARAIFFVRDPVKRFVSAFNSRLRQGRPRYDAPWTRNEEIAFGLFRTPDALASALNSGDGALKQDAGYAMHAVRHVNAPLSRWLKSTDFLERARSRIFFVGDQENFDADVKFLLAKMGVSGPIPSLSETHRHRSPAGLPTSLSEDAKSNLRNWYSGDYPIYDWCLLNKTAINGLRQAADS